jgi:D-alanyl-lipoteichoic acid acyltransferase DltB (MBOAT superfamily)
VEFWFFWSLPWFYDWGLLLDQRLLDKLNNIVYIFLTFQIAALGWLIFRSNSLEQALKLC